MASSKHKFKFGNQAVAPQEAITGEMLIMAKSKLKKVGVYYASATATFGSEILKRIENHLPTTHGFIAVGDPGTKNKKGNAQTYQCGVAIMLAPFQVNAQLIEAVSKSSKFSKETKDIIKKMLGKNFPSREHFQRAFLLHKISKDTPTKRQIKRIYQNAINNNDPELEALITLEVRINGYTGSVLARLPSTNACKTDRIRFESDHNVNYKLFPNIQSIHVLEVFREQLTYALYMEEKSGVGKSVDIALKQKISESSTSKVISSLVRHVLLPSNDNKFVANCNKSTASLLQAIENRSASVQKRKPQLITGPNVSAVSFGDEQRMHLWNPLSQSQNMKHYCFINQLTQSLEALKKRLAQAKDNQITQRIFAKKA